MTQLQVDLDQPVELRFRGDALDVFGALMAMMTPALEDGIENERAQEVIEDLADEVNRQVNLGHYQREAKRMLNRGDIPDYRGIQVLVDEFDPRYPELTGAGAEHMTPLEEAKMYAVVSLTDEGFETGGYPASMEDLEMLQMASMLRIYARDMEQTVTGAAYDLREAGDEPE